MLTYEVFRDKIQRTLRQKGPLTWTDIRTVARLPEKLPNNKWVRKLEDEIGLKRTRDSHRIILWSID